MDGHPTISSGHPRGHHGDVTAPTSHLESLARRVEELEKVNQLLLSRISSCPRCSKIPESLKDDIDFSIGTHLPDGTSVKAISSNKLLSSKSEKKCGSFAVGSCESSISMMMNQSKEEAEQVDCVSYKNLDCMKYGLKEDLSQCQQQKKVHHSNKRYIALKIMYFGQRFYGFASEAQKDPTIESELFKALHKTNLLVSKREYSNYSRCGRTDKGVSATGQVISLFLRSNFKGGNDSEGRCEIDYVKVLNRALPKDIRVMGWCPVSASFNSRFSCLSREYKYYFWREALDISVNASCVLNDTDYLVSLAMQVAGSKFVGEHDFRNFCKMDAANVSNYRRKIISFEISCSKRFDDGELWVVTICGSAFLWHQVRCTIAVLFMIGQGLESPGIIDLLLDTEKIRRKPQYVMAPDLPLVLWSCKFDDINFYCSPGGSFLVFGDKKSRHIPLISRSTEPSYDERCAKLVTKKILESPTLK